MKTDALRRAALAAVYFLLSVGLVTPSGAPVPQTAERPLVIDFYALGADGMSLPDLKTEEVTIRISGRTRTLKSLRLVKQGEPPAENPLAARPAARLTPFATNGIAEAGRSFVIVIDDESFRPGRERPVRSALATFISALTPKDRLSLWTVPHGGMKVDLTTNHDRFSQAVQLVVGHGPDRETGSEAACRSRTALEETEHLLSALAGGEGPTTLIFMTASLFGPRRDNPLTMAPGMCELTPEHFQRLGRAAASARAHFYIVQTEDLVGGGGLVTENIAGAGFKGNENPLEGIENMAGVTGGTRLALTRAGDQTLLPIARGTVSYYSAVIDGSSNDVDGAQGLDVRVSRSGVTVRSRALIHIKRATGPTIKPATPAEMVRTMAFYPDLPLRVAAYASLNSPGEMRIITAAEPVDPEVKLTALSAALFNAKGQMEAQVNATEPELASMPALAGMLAPAGTYRLRVAAVDSTGRSGAVDTELVAEAVSAGPLKMSSLVLGISREGRFLPRLQFSNEPVGVAYLDIFGGEANTPVAAIIEVTTLTGTPIVTNRLALEASADAGRVRASGSVPIGALPPGDYIARAIIGIEGHPFGVVQRAFRKIGQ